MTVYAAVRSFPATGLTTCPGHPTPRPVAAGSTLVLVQHRARFAADPDAMDAHAYLCAACVERLGDRCDPALPLDWPLPSLPASKDPAF